MYNWQVLSVAPGKLLWRVIYHHWYIVMVSHKRYKIVFCGLFNFGSYYVSMVARYLA